MSPCPAVLGDCRQEGVICTPLLQSKLLRMNVAALTQLEASAAFWAPLAAKTPPGDLLRAPFSPTSSGARCFVTLALWQIALKPASPSRGCDVGVDAFSSVQAEPRLLLLQRFILTAGGGYGNVSPRDSRCCVMCPAEVMRSQLAETSFRLLAR